MKHQSPKARDGLFWAVFIALGAIIQIAVVSECMHPHIVISKDSLINVCTTGAQVVAGMYGLTLTGYVFYSDKLKNAAEQDESLRDIVDARQKRYFALIVLISVMSLVAFCSSMMLLLYGSENHIIPEFWHRLVLLETFEFNIRVIAVILYLVVAMLDPKATQRESMIYKQQISSDKEPAGSVREFLRNYQEIELQLLTLQRKNSPDLHLRPDPERIHEHPRLPGPERRADIYRRHNSEEILIELLPEALVQKVVTVRKYRNFLIHSHKWSVTQSMCDLAAEVDRELKELICQNESNLS